MNSDNPQLMPPARPDWSLLSHHGIVLFVLYLRPNSTLRQVGSLTGFTERTLYTIIRDLTEARMILVERFGRTKSYTLHPDAHFKHPLVSHVKVATVFDMFKS